jgi:hypothetical protein
MHDGNALIEAAEATVESLVRRTRLTKEAKRDARHLYLVRKGEHARAKIDLDLAREKLGALLKQRDERE